ncbi:MAG: CDP-glycerol--glycerophosphate glycerophosphotransferase [Ruminococcaceae bacterium]|nr:CDP-glycerol--glycerophosphate glycerophosphotransferase [Oscillospiraceae bacterium]
MSSGLKSALVEGSFFLSLRKKIDSAIGKMSRKFFYRKGQVKNNKLFVMTFDNGYNCNPRYIVEEILRQNLPIDIVWAGDKNSIKSGEFPSKVRVVKCKSFEMYEEQASAKIWLDNGLSCIWYNMPKKKNQYYINTWHGSMGIKKLHGDAQWMALAKKFKKVTDYMVANSAFEEEVYRTTFWPKTPILKCGHARNDVLFEKENFAKMREDVAQYFETDTNKKFLLYAPTFRDNGDISCFNIDYEKLKKSLEEKYGGEWVILVRMHFKNRSEVKSFEPSDWLKDAGKYPDMQKLIAVADFGITDYSSWAYDYVLTRRPMVLYAPDVKKYQKGRGLYYPLEETPFPIVHNNKELAEEILNFDENKYQSDIDKFLEARGCYEEGTAARQVVEHIKKLMNITD